jgi:nitrite reductase (NADH) small subunit
MRRTAGGGRSAVARTRVFDLVALKPREPALVSVDGRDVMLYRRGDEIFAIGNTCPHEGGSLCDGWVEGEIVTCPLHGWEFDLRSGACMTIPGESVPRFTVTVEDGGIWLEEAP